MHHTAHVSLAFVLTAVAVAQDSTGSLAQPDLQAGIGELCEKLDARMKDLHVPGVALGVVQGDRVILARGFGMADLEEEQPVGSETLFAIGSTTKAFTSALIGTLVDEGLMDWDDPISEHLPYFDPAVMSEDEDAHATLRDLLSHRTGFARMTMLWAGGSAPTELILRTAGKAEPWTAFREGFLYNNLMYIAAGTAAAKASETDWGALLEERLFEPLGMSSTRTRLEETLEDPRVAMGYMWMGDEKGYDTLPMRHLDEAGPAGGIASNVLDMTRWLRLLLEGGELDGQRLISEEALAETWTGQNRVGPGIEYGMGWFLREWRGQPMLEHGGNVDGFSTQIAILPESDLAFVMLTNLAVAPLQSEAIDLVFGSLVPKEPAAEAEGKPEDFEPFLGTYLANFIGIKDGEVSVLVQNGRLAVDIPGQRIFELEAPDEDGQRAFSLTNAIRVRFDRNDRGEVFQMHLQQMGMDFEFPREGVEFEPDLPLDELRKYLGDYHSEKLGTVVHVLIRNNRLAVDWPGEMVYWLHPPNEDGIWEFRATSMFRLRFTEDAEGRVESLTYYQSGMELVMPRVSSGSAAELPTIDEIAALRKVDELRASLEGLGTFRLTGGVRLPNSGMEGKVTTLARGSASYVLDVDLGAFGFILQGVHGEKGWADSEFSHFRELGETAQALALQEHPAAWCADWNDYFETVHVTGAAELRGKAAYVLQFEGAGRTSSVYMDAATGDVLQVQSVVPFAGSGSGVPVETRFEDFREVGGLRIPFRITSTNIRAGSRIVQFDTVETGLELGEETFALTPDWRK